MKALILAAGLGSRLQHKTSDRPKALTELNGKTILDFQLAALLHHECSEIGIVLGYQGQKIIDFMAAKYPKLKIQYFWNPEFNSSNSSYSWSFAFDWIRGGTYLHFNCDILFTPDFLGKLLDFPEENVLAIRTDVALGGHLEHVSLHDKRITAMSITKREDSVGKAFGLAKFGSKSTDFLFQNAQEYFKKGDKNQHHYGLIRQAIAQIPYYALEAKEDLLLEVNTLADFDLAQVTLKKYETFSTNSSLPL